MNSQRQPVNNADITAALRDFAATELGHGLSVTDRSRVFGRRSVTWRVETLDGTSFYLKRHEHYRHYEAEKVALQKWAPKIKQSARWSTPGVFADSTELGALILQELPGEVMEDTQLSLDDEIEIYRTAGWLASQVHSLDVDPYEAGPPRLYDSATMQGFIEGAVPYLDAATLQWAAQVTSVDGLFDGLAVVPTHSDFSPRNWLVHGSQDGPVLGLIDWERARPSYWLEDTQRMATGHWLNRTELRDAFMSGYGRTPAHALTPKEERQLKLICLGNALATVSWATEHDDTEFAQFGRMTLERLKSELS